RRHTSCLSDWSSDVCSSDLWFDAHSLLTLLRGAARQKSAHYIHGEVTGIERAGTRVAGVRLANGERIACGALVNAAGPQAGEVEIGRASCRGRVWSSRGDGW